MKKKDLEIRLLEDGVPARMYSLEGGLRGDTYCLAQTDNKWEVYYSERGIKSGLRIFESEEDACEFFYKKITIAFHRFYK